MPELVRSIVNVAKVFINTINIIAMHVCIIGIYVLSFSNTLPHAPYCFRKYLESWQRFKRTFTYVKEWSF